MFGQVFATGSAVRLAPIACIQSNSSAAIINNTVDAE
jgi:hypothetical protein